MKNPFVDRYGDISGFAMILIGIVALSAIVGIPTLIGYKIDKGNCREVSRQAQLPYRHTLMQGCLLQTDSCWTDRSMVVYRADDKYFRKVVTVKR